MSAGVTTQDARAARWAALDKQPAPAWLQDRRRDAWAQFETLGFPTVRDEAWRHTDVARIARGTFTAPDGVPASAPAARLAARWTLDLDGPQLVFVNGRFAPDLSAVHGLPPGAVVGALGVTPSSGAPWLAAHYANVAGAAAHAFTALSTALAVDGAVLYVPRGVVLETPVRVLYLSVGTPAGAPEWHARLLVVAEEAAAVQIVEMHAGDGPGYSNVISELVLGASAQVDHVKVQSLPAEALHTARACAALGRDARCNSWSFALGAGLARNEFEVAFAGPGGECALDGLWIGAGTQHLDNQTYVDHAQPQCASRQLYKGILTDAAHGVFNGRVMVRPGAQQTNARQTNHNLLLSEAALVDTKPQLEIFADDVQCTHGATIGRLDDMSLFYLRSRGIGAADARALLVRAFAHEIVSRVRPEAARAGIEQLLAARLPAVTAAPPPGGAA